MQQQATPPPPQQQQSLMQKTLHQQLPPLQRPMTQPQPQAASSRPGGTTKATPVQPRQPKLSSAAAASSKSHIAPPTNPPNQSYPTPSSISTSSYPKRPGTSHPRDEPPDIVVDDLDSSYTALDLAHQRLLFLRNLTDRLFPVGPDCILRNSGKSVEICGLGQTVSIESLLREQIDQMERRSEGFFSAYENLRESQRKLFQALEECQSLSNLERLLVEWQEVTGYGIKETPILQKIFH